MPKMDIFVVDDERVIGQTLGIILRNAGYRVEVFEDPQAALLAMHRAPRLLLTDNNMPRLSGCSLASLYATTQPEIAILLFSGALAADDLEWQVLHRQAPGSRLLHKPVHPTRILDEVRRAIGSPSATPSAVPRRDTSAPWAGLLKGVMQSGSLPAMIRR